MPVSRRRQPSREAESLRSRPSDSVSSGGAWGWGPTRSKLKSACGHASRGHENPRRGISVSSRRVGPRRRVINVSKEKITTAGADVHSKAEWKARVLAPHQEAEKPRKPEFATSSGLPLEPVYTPE